VSRECFGLVGGLGVGAAVHYYRELAKAHDAAQVPMDLVMVHADMQRMVRWAAAGDARSMADYVAGLIARMQAAGATFAALPAVTPHMCMGELLPISPLPLVNLLETVADAVRRSGFRRVALFGTRFTVESGMFGALNGPASGADPLVCAGRPVPPGREAGLGAGRGSGDPPHNVPEAVKPRPEEVAEIHRIYFQLASTGAGGDAEREGLSRIAETLMRRDGVEAIIMAGTDLALIFDESNTPFPHLECARVHIDEILRTMLA
jgi:aspartate racemase